jgi:hypothetical protein
MAISIYDPRVLDSVVKIMPTTGGFFRDTFFKRHLPVTGSKVDVDFFKGKRRISPFVNPKSQSKGVSKIGYKTNTFETPLLKPKDVTTIEDLMVRIPGENVYGGLNMEERAIYLLSEKLQEFNDMNIRREEWMCAQAMLTGTIPVIGEGVNYVIDFGFTNTKTLLTTARWNDANTVADPLADIDGWVLTCQQKGYHTPTDCLMERTAYNAFLQRVKALYINNTLSDVLQLVELSPRQLSENVIWAGRIIKYNINIWIYNEWFIDDWTDPKNPVELPLVPTGTVMLASQNAKTAIYYGELVVTDDTAANGFRSIIGERAAQTWTEKDPPARFLALHSRPLTVPQEVDSWFVATVL